ncbi:MAG: hypothetical protein ACODAJ_02895 [Planctomycetota bacterium]
MGTGPWTQRVGLLAVVVLAEAAVSAGDAKPAGPDLAAKELWRRGLCILSRVVVPARRASKAPRDLRGAKAVAGRIYSAKIKITAWARDDRFLWAATDTQLHQIDLAGHRLVRSYGKADGLPDWPVDALLSDGRTLWIVHRRGLATLTTGAERVQDREDIRFRFASLHRDDGGVWVIADDATLRFADEGAPRRLPALPTGTRIARTLERGIWLARRRRQTAYYVADPQSLDGRLYLASFGAVYELADGSWSRVAAEGWSPRVGHGAVWFLSTKGLVRHDPASKQSRSFGAPEPLPSGRPTHLLVTNAAVWVAVEPQEKGGGRGFAGGGIARLDVGSGKWQRWAKINGQRADRVTALEARDGAVWATALGYQDYKTLSAHPGMMHCKRTVPIPTGLALHRYDPSDGAWRTIAMETPDCERRRILGQRGKQRDGVMVPRIVDATAASRRRLFGIVRMFPKNFYSGYYTTVDQLAARQDLQTPWEARYAHHPQQLGLQGEQPSVLLISESHGKRVVYGVGHDHVLGLFALGDQAWAVTEGGVGWFEEAAARWRRVLTTGFRFYWKATAALDDGEHLWVGSDRGIVARLDLATNRFVTLAEFQGRRILNILPPRDGKGCIVDAGLSAKPGCLPVQLGGALPVVEPDVAAFDGKSWQPTKLPRLTDRAAGWRTGKQANFLLRVDPDTRKRRPAYYLTGVFQPQVLCASPDGRRLWLATYSGLVRVDTQP